MKKLLSLPPNLVECFHDITGYDRQEWFCTHDPVNQKLGSGGGSVWLVDRYLAERKGLSGEKSDTNETSCLSAEERYLLLHAGGQSRRLPSYAPSGKILTPIPVFRWARGQRLSQNLLSLQVPLYEKILNAAPRHLNVMIVSGDVYIRATQPLQPIPDDVDIVCYGLWLGPEIAQNHGVFVSSREHPTEMECMLQKPSVETLSNLQKDHYYLTDIGVWLLSDKAMTALARKSKTPSGEYREYDLYGTFGCALGSHPSLPDPELADLKVAVLPLPGGEFYHFGTSRELLSSTLAIQNLVNDQREIMHHSRKPHPSIFVQNAITEAAITGENRNLWIENSFVGRHWMLTSENIITGVPENDWALDLEPCQCVDIVPLDETAWVVRPYGYYDKFAGSLQQQKLFPVVRSVADMGEVLQYMLKQNLSEHARKLYDEAEKLSAEDISANANLRRLEAQRRRFRAEAWPRLASNYEHSVFYQLDLEHAAQEFAQFQLPMPERLPAEAPLLIRIHDAMFRGEPDRAFGLLREGLTRRALEMKQTPHMNVYADQIVWGRSPVRIDLAGGWTDTPPYCLTEGGNVVNLAIELNGQPPLQTYVKPCKERKIILRSIDLGSAEEITTYEQLADFNKVGSPFSIPKAALVLSGFQPGFSSIDYPSLSAQLEEFGCGIELTMLSAIPAGSGLGTSSILAATVLGALNDFCGLSWDKNEIGQRTLVLEQLLTTGGGWQDQFGGLLPGIKLLQTGKGFSQEPMVKFLPTEMFTGQEYAPCHLLYYTGITRTAKDILSQIVRRMFLNQHEQLELLSVMKQHALDMYDAIVRQDFALMGQLVRKSWQLNQLLDSGTNPASVDRLTALVDDLCLGYKLLGAGGGGYLYMIAKDPDAAARIKQRLQADHESPNARFVDLQLSKTGLQVSRS
nr:bifunctional fucokinase/fucose-1-phosphate guanylyltransferase [uncultured Prevotella sp.]